MIFVIRIQINRGILMDWNIFFSTISQTSGAIVGIFSAFLITKVVANQSDFNINKEKIILFLEESKFLKDECLVRKFEWYNNIIAKLQIEDIDEYYINNRRILSVDEYYKHCTFSPFESRAETLNIIQTKIDELYKKEKSINSRSKLLADKHPIKINSELIKSKNDEKERIDNLFIRIKYQVNLNNNFLNQINENNQSSFLITLSIIATLLLFFTGVIYPLSFLPLDPKQKIILSLNAFFEILISFKGFFLLVISIIWPIQF